ncbi:hypothetical protein THAOC_23073, partial [Thalassiosira oceanica]
MHNWTKTGDVDNLLLEKITRKVCDDRLFASVKAKYDKLDESHRYGQVMLFLAIQEALLLDETTLKTMEDWVQRDDLCQLFGGDLKSLIEVIESVLTVLLKPVETGSAKLAQNTRPTLQYLLTWLVIE